MNYSEYIEATTSPLYQVEGEMPSCPKGYRWDNTTMRCVPKSQKDSVSGPKGQGPNAINPSFRVWGNTGYDGGYAWEEPPTTQDLSDMGEKP